MNLEVIQKLNQTNTNFYSQVCESFSDTRSVPWQGWDKVIEYFFGLLGGCSFSNPSIDTSLAIASSNASEVINSKNFITFNIRDIGCGNKRFMRFVQEKLPKQFEAMSIIPPADALFMNFENIDSCIELMLAVSCSSDVNENQDTSVRQDIIESLINGVPIGRPDEFKAHLSCSFGVFHHIPTMELRKKFLYEIAQGCEKNGVIAISLWQFMNDERLARKAMDFTFRAAQMLDIAPENLDQGDYFLGWKDSDTAVRYCHHFSHEDINELSDYAKSIGLDIIGSFEADGKSGRLNRYLIFQCK